MLGRMSESFGHLRSALAYHYALERGLGEGGSGKGTLAGDGRDSRNVARKGMHPELALRRGAERFLKEIETTANLLRHAVRAGGIAASPA